MIITVIRFNGESFFCYIFEKELIYGPKNSVDETIQRSNHCRVLQKELFLKNSKYSQEKVAEFQGPRPGTSLKRDSSTGVFSVNIAKVLRTVILKNICERLLQNLRIKFSKPSQNYIPAF